MKVRNNIVGVALAMGLVGAMVPAAAQEAVKPVLTSATRNAGNLDVVVRTDPSVDFGYIQVILHKWNANRSKWVKKGAQFAWWTDGTDNSWLTSFQKAPGRGKCRLVAKYWDSREDKTFTKNRKIFKCGQGF